VKKIYFLVISLILLVPVLLFSEKKTNQLDVSYMHEHIEPSDKYTSWESLNINYFREFRKDLRFNIFSIIHMRDDNSMILGVNTTKDISNSFFVSAGITFGLETNYTSKYRLDGALNYKVLKDKNLLLTMGGTYIDYYDEHSDKLIFFSPSLYLGYFITSYKIQYAVSDPGSKAAFSHFLSAGYGMEKKHWTYLNLKYGQQAYLSLITIDPQDVDLDEWEVKLNHRFWIKNDIGVFGEIGFLQVIDEYEKYSFTAGFFWNF